MSDDSDAWPDPWPEPVVYEEWLQEKLRSDKEWLEKHRAEAEQRRMERIKSGFKSLAPAGPTRDPVVREARLEEFKDNPKLRKWAIWRQYRAGGTTFNKVGEDFGIGVERTRQLVHKCDRMLRDTLNRAKPGVPANAEVREATRGVEFVFCNGLTLEDTKGWQQLELTLYGSRYAPPRTDWREEWGHQDTLPAKPIPAYTFYKVIIPKE
jgi:hypothetical protein